MDADALTVAWNDEQSRWEARSPEGLLAGRLDVVRDDDAKVVDLTHTVVEPAVEGRGVGGRLVRAALDDAREHGLRAVPSCPFVGAWVEKHPDYADLLV